MAVRLVSWLVKIFFSLIISELVEFALEIVIAAMSTTLEIISIVVRVGILIRDIGVIIKAIVIIKDIIFIIVIVNHATIVQLVVILFIVLLGVKEEILEILFNVLALRAAQILAMLKAIYHSTIMRRLTSSRGNSRWSILDLLTFSI